MVKHIIKCGDCLELIKEQEKASIDLLVTSPPYWAKRIYNGSGELGSEPTPEEYVKTLADYFDTFKPYIKKTGNLFINIGDTYFGSGAGAWNKYVDDNGDITQYQKERKEKYFTLKPLQPKIKQNGRLYQNKQLLLIPSRFAIEMQERGWILRDDIIWHKPNRIPASVKDRFNNMYEHVFHFVMAKSYYFDLDSVKVLGANGKMKNPGDIWAINTQPLDGDHTASFPEKLVEQIISCASPENGIVYDPFMGTGTSWIVSDRLNRNFIGHEINQGFCEYAKDRVEKTSRGENIAEIY
ncbi:MULTISPECIES: DNA-methyltransferase [Sporomusaceae]|uniref:Methyltransferase n=1 Tax=Propionispora hippei DSM 15287 TaxID=1123003 RepID=A0A1M6GH83_9FIRM|nr:MULTISPECIES: site-specific DNA-methyltransferase [Sporomusaceae]SHJ09261.1 site-specific DNA-methyltransferase (adenine-specific) [Propionispora hippei DSM 15287]